MEIICNFICIFIRKNMFTYAKKCKKYAKIWTHPHINVKYNNNVKYEEVSYRGRDLPAAGRSRAKICRFA